MFNHAITTHPPHRRVAEEATTYNYFCYTSPMTIDPNHPRAQSLRTRERIVWGVRHGLTSEAGLIAHGRGEAFDYLLGETTHPFAHRAIEAAAAHLLLAKKPILSINGNVVAVGADEMIRLAGIIPAKMEVNLFHYTKARVQTIERYLKKKIPKHADLLLSYQKARTVILPHIASSRKITLHDGIATADVVLVPLEDGDRCQALVGMGKTVLTIDLNPLSRTAQSATVTIVDNITRALPCLTHAVQQLRNNPEHALRSIVQKYDNREILAQATAAIRSMEHTLPVLRRKNTNF